MPYPLFTPSPHSVPHSDYVYDDYIVSAVQFAISLRRPLLVSGPPGSGKTSLGRDVANTLGLRYYKYVISSRTNPVDLCYHIDAEQRIWDAQGSRNLPEVSDT